MWVLIYCYLFLKICTTLKTYWAVCWQQNRKCYSETSTVNEAMVRYIGQRSGLINLLVCRGQEYQELSVATGLEVLGFRGLGRSQI